MGNLQKDMGQIKKVVIDGDGPNNPSLVTALAVFNGKLDVLNATAKLIVRIILGAVILLLSNEFFGPTIRHMLHIPDSSKLHPVTQSERRPMHAVLPPQIINQ